MRIICLADLHGFLPDIPDGDVAIIAGDICPASDHSFWFQQQWLDGSFRNWAKNLPVKHVVFCAGNHDLYFDGKSVKAPDHLCFMPDWPKNVHYLQDSSIVIDGVKIYGSPWSLDYCDWAFMGDEYKLYDKVRSIPDDVNIWLSHSPANGIMDFNKWGNCHIGACAIRDKALSLPNLKLFVFGHLHQKNPSGNGPDGDLVKNGIRFVNATIVNEAYEMVYPPIIVDL